MMDKKTDFVGDSYKVPIIITRPQGVSSTFATAQTNKKPTNYQAFYLQRVKHYALASITTEAILASQNDAGAFLRLATGEIDGAIDSLTRTIAYQMYGDSNAVLGQLASSGGISSTTCQLANPEDIVKIEVGQVLEFWTAASGGSAHGAQTVVSVNRDAGSFVVDSAGTIANSDFVFVQGDRGNGISGLAGWLPSATPSSALFFGVDRTVDSSRLSGQRIDCSALPIEEALIQSARRVAREGGQPSHCFLSFDRYAALEKSLGTKIRYEDKKIGEVSFQSIRVNGPKGDIAVLADQDAPANRGHLLDMKGWSLYSLGSAVQILDLDGNKMLRESNADAMEVRVGFFGNVGGRSPGFNGVMLF
jgi:hypothetical protein